MARSDRINSEMIQEKAGRRSVRDYEFVRTRFGETRLSVSRRDIIRDSRARWKCPAGPRENGYLDSWTVRGRPRRRASSLSSSRSL